MADNTLQEIKDRLDVTEIISSYIPIKKSGSNFKAVCPFHNEKTASLMISPQKQIWHCFGCGEGGDIFGFVMKYENLEFREALKHLAQLAGVTLPEHTTNYQQTDKKQLEDLVRINNFSAKFFAKQLTTEQASQARSYLDSRGLSTQTIEVWGLGFAPNSFESLHKALQSKQVSDKQAVLAGVLGKNEQGKVYDRFRNRIIFPIKDFYGDVVGFTARVLPGTDEQMGKYINSPETPIYNKSKIMFGLYNAKGAIRKNDEAVVVEGQMDCITAHQAGFENTVATSGTAMTEDHLRLIGRITKNLKLCFDADSAGALALRRAGELALHMGFKVKVVTLPPEAKDPDELIQKNPGLWRKVVTESSWFIDHYINLAEQNFALGSLEQKQYITSDIIPLLNFTANLLEQGHFIRTISEKFAISENELLATVKTEQNRKKFGALAVNGITEERRARISVASQVTQESIQEKEILGGLRMYSEYREFVAEEGLPTEYISDNFQALINSALLNEPLPSSLQTPAMDALVKEAEFMVESNLDKLENNELALIRELKKSFYLFKKSGINKQLQDATIAIKKAESLNDTMAIKQQTELFTELTAQRYNIEQKLEN